MSLSDYFRSIQNKSYTDSRDFPVEITEYHSISGSLTEANRKIKLSEKAHSLDSAIVCKIFKSSDSLDLQLINYDDLAIYYTQIDITINYISYDSTNDAYSFNIILYRSDSHENQSKDFTLTGELGSNNIAYFNTIWGKFNIVLNNFVSGAKVILSIIGYESAIMVIDTMNVFVSSGVSNHLWFNVPANSLYINEIPAPWSSGDICVLVKYLGLGSIITATDLNDILNVVKYYNLLPKFDVTKVNNNDIQLNILGEFYYLVNYIEKFEDTKVQLEDTILIAQQNAIVCFLDIANHIFNVRRCAVGDTYSNLLADLTEFIVDNPDYEIPLFILIFDTNKNLYEYSYVRNGFLSSGSTTTLYKYTTTFTSATHVTFSMTTSGYAVITVYDSSDEVIIPDSVEKSGNVISVYFGKAQSGTIVAVN